MNKPGNKSYPNRYNSQITNEFRKDKSRYNTEFENPKRKKKTYIPVFIWSKKQSFTKMMKQRSQKQSKSCKKIVHPEKDKTQKFIVNRFWPKITTQNTKPPTKIDQRIIALP